MVSTNYQKVKAELDAFCKTAGRFDDIPKLICVSKTVGPDEVACAIEDGATDFGENRVGELVLKQELFPQVRWHFIGNIQHRDIPQIVKHAALIHSVYKIDHLHRIDNAAASIGKIQDILVEVNVVGEESKGGLAPSNLPAFLEEALKYPHIRVCGLMTMAPQGIDSAIHRSFEGLASLLKQSQEVLSSDSFGELSMGMSEDWKVAVSCGSSMIRLGRAVFDVEFENH